MWGRGDLGVCIYFWRWGRASLHVHMGAADGIWASDATPPILFPRFFRLADMRACLYDKRRRLTSWKKVLLICCVCTMSESPLPPPMNGGTLISKIIWDGLLAILKMTILLQFVTKYGEFWISHCCSIVHSRKKKVNSFFYSSLHPFCCSVAQNNPPKAKAEGEWSRKEGMEKRGVGWGGDGQSLESSPESSGKRPNVREKKKEKLLSKKEGWHEKISCRCLRNLTMMLLEVFSKYFFVMRVHLTKIFCPWRFDVETICRQIPRRGEKRKV